MSRYNTVCPRGLARLVLLLLVWCSCYNICVPAHLILK